MKGLVAAVLVCALVLIGGCQKAPVGLPKTYPRAEVTVSPTPTEAPRVQSLADALRSHNSTAAARSQSRLKLVKYDGAFFTVKKPVGWEVITAGAYGTFAFILRDPENPTRQVFYLGEISPLYMSQKQKSIDRDYMNAGGYKIAWYDMPVISPLVPSRLFLNFDKIAASEIARGFMPKLPRLSDFAVLSEVPVDSPFKIGKTTLTRGFFVQNGMPCEGQFLATVAPYMPAMNGPGGGTAIAARVVGITAPVSEFRDLEGDLATCVESFQFSSSYVQAGIAQSKENFKGVMKAGQTLRETSEIITDGWESRNKSDDIISQKRSDAMLGYERLYDPATGDVYQVEGGFYEQYDANRGSYKLDDLRPLPEGDYTLWDARPLGGGAIK